MTANEDEDDYTLARPDDENEDEYAFDELEDEDEYAPSNPLDLPSVETISKIHVSKRSHM